MDIEYLTKHSIEIEKQNIKCACNCGGKYNNHSKEKHLQTKIHRKYEENIISRARMNERYKQQGEEDRLNKKNDSNVYNFDTKKNISSRYGMGGWMDRC